MLALALSLPILVVLLMTLFYVNYRTLVLLRRERELKTPIVRRGSKKLFIVDKG